MPTLQHHQSTTTTHTTKRNISHVWLLRLDSPRHHRHMPESEHPCSLVAFECDPVPADQNGAVHGRLGASDRPAPHPACFGIGTLGANRPARRQSSRTFPGSTCVRAHYSGRFLPLQAGGHVRFSTGHEKVVFSSQIWSAKIYYSDTVVFRLYLIIIVQPLTN
jgi:hypothetical protein